MRTHRGQAAMEFLMTYGWAILVVLAAITALAYFGVLSPDRFLPDKCTASPPFACTQWKINTTGVNVFLQNSAGVDMANMTLGWTCDNGAAATAITGNGGTPTLQTAGGVGKSLAHGSQLQVVITCASAPQIGQRWKSNYTITYTKSGESVSHVVTGTIQGRGE